MQMPRAPVSHIASTQWLALMDHIIHRWIISGFVAGFAHIIVVTCGGANRHSMELCCETSFLSPLVAHAILLSEIVSDNCICTVQIT